MENHLKLRYAKIVAGPLVGILLFFMLRANDVASEAASVALLCVWMALWWMTEAVPIELTALLPIVYLPFTGLHSQDGMMKACAPYADKTVFFFLGGFALGIAIEKTALHRRGALILLHLAGTNASMVVGAFMLATALLSMWMNNTATTILMLPLATSVIATQSNERFATSLLLGVAYAASIGGMGTLVGTAPNMFFAGFMDNRNMPIGFLPWMGLAMPIVGFLLVGAWIWMVFVLWPIKGLKVETPEAWRQEWNDCPKLSSHQVTTLIVFASAALTWMLRQPCLLLLDYLYWLKYIPDPSMVHDWLKLVEDSWIAMAGMLALLLFPFKDPVLRWDDIEKSPWGVLLLLGGGLSLAKAISDSKLDQSIASCASLLQGVPPWLILTIIVVGVIGVSELASNLATATTLLPILATAGPAMHVDQVSLLCATVLASSCGFMLPVATPPNTLVYAQRRFPARSMMLAGAGLNLLGIIAIPIAVWWLKPLVLGSQ